MDWGSIGARIRKQREFMGLTREQLAELLEVTPKSLRIRKQVLDHAQRMRNIMKSR